MALTVEDLDHELTMFKRDFDSLRADLRATDRNLTQRIDDLGEQIRDDRDEVAALRQQVSKLVDLVSEAVSQLRSLESVYHGHTHTQAARGSSFAEQTTGPR